MKPKKPLTIESIEREFKEMWKLLEKQDAEFDKKSHIILYYRAKIRELLEGLKKDFNYWFEHGTECIEDWFPRKLDEILEEVKENEKT